MAYESALADELPRRRPRALPALRPHRHAVRPRLVHLPEHREAARAVAAARRRAARDRARRRRADRARLRLRDAARAPTGRPSGLLAHVDTSPDAPGTGVEPQVHDGYDGGELVAGLSPATSSLLAERVGPRHRHLRRDDAARRRRQGRRGRDHGGGRLSRRAIPRSRMRPRGSRSPSTRRSGTAPTTSTSSGSGPTSPTRWTAPRSARSRTRPSRRSSSR